jgi:hypothetical protein
MFNVRAALFVLCLVACLLCLDAVHATVLLPADFETVVNESTAIVHGRVVEVRSVLTGPRRMIESFVTVTVIESLKGAAVSNLVFRVPNGQVGRYRRVLVGAPEFAVGDEVVLFLEGKAPAIPSVFGLSQGVYRIGRDRASRAVVTPPPVMARGVGAERVVRGDPARTALPVDDFTRQVRAVLERAR